MRFSSQWQEKNVVHTSAEWGTKKEKRKSARKKFFLVFMAVAMALVISFLLYWTKAETIDASGFIEIRFSGADGYGNAEASLDKNLFNTTAGSKLKLTLLGKQEMKKRGYSNENSEQALLEDPAEVFFTLCADSSVSEMPSITLSKSILLSNGETVCASWSGLSREKARKFFNVNLIPSTEHTVNVEGLADLQPYDAFSKISLTFSGAAPYGELEIDSAALDEMPVYMDVCADRTQELSNGDTVTLQISCNKYSLGQAGYSLVADTKEYTVSGLPVFITSESQIAEDAFSGLKSRAEDLFREMEDSGRRETFSSVYGRTWTLNRLEYVGSYIQLIRPETLFTEYGDERLLLVFRAEETVTDTQTGTADQVTSYFPVIFLNAKISPGGTFMTENDDTMPVQDEFSFVSADGTEISAYGYADLPALFDGCVGREKKEMYFEDNVKGDGNETGTMPGEW